VEKNPTIINFPVKNLEMKDYIRAEDLSKNPVTKYDLVAAIQHEGNPNDGIYRVFVLNRANEQWYEMQDLIVKDAVPQMIALSEAYMLFYERRDVKS